MSDLVKLLLAFGLGYVLGALGMFCFIFRECSRRTYFFA